MIKVVIFDLDSELLVDLAKCIRDAVVDPDTPIDSIEENSEDWYFRNIAMDIVADPFLADELISDAIAIENILIKVEKIYDKSRKLSQIIRRKDDLILVGVKF